MIGCLRTRVPKQPIIALYFESESELKLYNLEAWYQYEDMSILVRLKHTFEKMIFVTTFPTYIEFFLIGLNKNTFFSYFHMM